MIVLKARIKHDLELLQERGFCPGIENYSRHFDGRIAGKRPFCLFDFFEEIFYWLLMSLILQFLNCRVCMRVIVRVKNLN